MTVLLRLFAILTLFVFAASACSHETNSNEPPITQDKSDTGTADADLADTDSTDTDPVDTSLPPKPDPCNSVEQPGTCFLNHAVWCDQWVRTHNCAEMGATGCSAGVCTGIQKGYECDDRRECAPELICRRGKCTGAAPGDLIVGVRGNGRVTSPTLAINCGNECLATGPGFMEVILHAEPENGWKFSHWTPSCCSDSATTQVTLISNFRRVCEATFERTQATVQVVVPHHSGTVKIEPSDTECIDDCTEFFELNQSVTLTATPSPGFQFKHWSGCSDSRETSITFIAKAGHQCTAVFQKNIAIAVEITGPGRVTSPQADIDCPETCESVILSGQRYDFRAIPDANARFVQWTGDCINSNSVNIYFNISDISQQPPPDQLHCTAIFEYIPLHPLTVSVVGEGRVTSNSGGIDCPGVSCSATYLEGSSVSLYATPAPNTRFISWTNLSTTDTSEDCVSSGATRSLRMRGARHCQAEFTPIPSLTQAWQYASILPNSTHALWSYDSTQFAVFNGKAIRLFDTETGDFVSELTEDFIPDLRPGPVAWFSSSHRSVFAFTGAVDLPNGSRQHRIYVFRSGYHPTYINVPAPVDVLAFGGGGLHLASAGADGIVHIWNLLNLRLITSWAAHNAPITALAWSPDSNRLATSSLLDNTRVWARINWQLEHEIAGSGWNSLAWSRDSTKLTGATHNQLHVWNVGKTQHTTWPAIDCKSASFNPTSTQLVATCDSKLVVYDIANQSQIYTAPPFGTTAVQSTHWSPTQDKILATYDDYSVRILHSLDGELIKAFPNGTDAAIHHLAYSSFTRQLYAADSDGAIHSFNPDDGAPIEDFNILKPSGSIVSMALSPDGETLLAAQGPYIYEWSTLTGASVVPPWNAGADVAHISLSDNDFLAASLAGTGNIHVWATRGNPPITTLPGTQPAAHISWQPGANRLASTAQNTVSLWDSETATVTHTSPCPTTMEAIKASFSNDGRYLALICNNNYGNTLLIFDTNDFTRSKSVTRFFDDIFWRPSTNTITMTHATNLHFLHPEGIALLSKNQSSPDTINSLAWSTDGRQLFVGSSIGVITAFNVTP